MPIVSLNHFQQNGHGNLLGMAALLHGVLSGMAFDTGKSAMLLAKNLNIVETKFYPCFFVPSSVMAENIKAGKIVAPDN